MYNILKFFCGEDQNTTISLQQPWSATEQPCYHSILGSTVIAMFSFIGLSERFIDGSTGNGYKKSKTVNKISNSRINLTGSKKHLLVSIVIIVWVSSFRKVSGPAIYAHAHATPHTIFGRGRSSNSLIVVSGYDRPTSSDPAWVLEYFSATGVSHSTNQFDW